MNAVQYLMSLPLAGSAGIKRPSAFDGLYSYEKVMLVCGVVLFVVLVAVLVVLILQKRNPLRLLLFFLLPIVMIGFPAVQKISFDNASAKLDDLVDNVRRNPGDPTAKEALVETVATVTDRPTKDPEVFLRLATANEVLGRQEQAAVELDKALRIQPDLPQAVTLRSRLELRRDANVVGPNPSVMEPNR